MTIITISRGSYSRGKKVAEKVAEKLGFGCIGRKLLLEASEEFNIPEIELRKALHDSPTIFDRFTFGKERYITYIRHALLQHLQQDNTVYHGLAGHFFLKNVPHVLKVRIIANFEDRVKEEMKREKMDEKEVRYQLAKDDNERRKWSLYLYNMDSWDPFLYDLVIHIDKLTVDDAADLIIESAKHPCFQSTLESQKIFDELLLAAKVQTTLIKGFPTVQTNCKNGTVYISCKGAVGQADSIKYEIKEKIKGIPGIDHFEISISPVIMPD
jgi:cytidylate kinase